MVKHNTVKGAHPYLDNITFQPSKIKKKPIRRPISRNRPFPAKNLIDIHLQPRLTDPDKNGLKFRIPGRAGAMEQNEFSEMVFSQDRQCVVSLVF